MVHHPEAQKKPTTIVIPSQEKTMSNAYEQIALELYEEN
jgi:hypothetical protein